MHGQLWQPCRCGAEPVCANCGYCARHCTCEQRTEDRRQIGEVNRRYPGFLDKIQRHHEDGANEH